jgi:hypothetical protein
MLDFVNRKYRINRKLKSIATAKELDPADVKKIANKLWSDVTAIYSDKPTNPVKSNV